MLPIRGSSHAFDLSKIDRSETADHHRSGRGASEKAIFPANVTTRQPRRIRYEIIALKILPNPSVILAKADLESSESEQIAENENIDLELYFVCKRL
jgi:hypothetical protein